jgi:hypothetical protein
VTFASANAARYFFNAGGLIKIDVSKTATGDFGDPEWNDLANTLCGDIYISGWPQQYHCWSGHILAPQRLADQAHPIH